jgi:hypothetical protein
MAKLAERVPHLRCSHGRLHGEPGGGIIHDRYPALPGLREKTPPPCEFAMWDVKRKAGPAARERSAAEPPGCTGNPGKRVIRVETLSRSAQALLPPHQCGGSQPIWTSRS